MPMPYPEEEPQRSASCAHLRYPLKPARSKNPFSVEGADNLGDALHGLALIAWGWLLGACRAVGECGIVFSFRVEVGANSLFFLIDTH